MVPKISPPISSTNNSHSNPNQLQKPRTAPGVVHLRFLGGLVDPSGGCLLRLNSDRVYTVGRRRRRGPPRCDVIVDGRCISRRHCQLFLDGSERKLRLADGVLLRRDYDLREARRRFGCGVERSGCSASRDSLNGVFVNGRRIRGGAVAELSVGNEVLLGCGGCGRKCGFLVERIVFSDDAVVGCAALANEALEDSGLKSVRLLRHLKNILKSPDPVSYLRNSLELQPGTGIKAIAGNSKMETQNLGLETCCNSLHNRTVEVIDSRNKSSSHVLSTCVNVNSPMNSTENIRTELVNPHLDVEACKKVTIEQSMEVIDSSNKSSNDIQGCKEGYSSLDLTEHTGNCHHESQLKKEDVSNYHSDGRKIFLNHLEFMNSETSDCRDGVTLPELLHPINTLVRVFIATFTCDVSWFLSSCQLPNLLPVTIACHNSEKCWSRSPNSRTSVPYVNYPNLLLVYPMFPEVIAFGKDRSKKGVACHHPKLIVLQREDSLRVIVTSANLVSKQWNYVTNTVWWQDFPRQNVPDYSAFFERTKDSKSDFAAQLAGFISSLIIDVPSQANWINELAKYDFQGAFCHLVASLPGIYVRNYCYPGASYCLSAKQIMKSKHTARNFLGSVQASVVGINHRFRPGIDSCGAQLKSLASLLGKCQENADGTIEVILKRNCNIPADANAVSVLVADLNSFSEGDIVNLGFLPREIAKWVSPLSDAGFFSFSAFIYPKEALVAALSANAMKVDLLVYVSQGPKFSEMINLIEYQHYDSLCSLLASMQRCLGMWRLQEVLSQYRWPESTETDFLYGSSSIGSSVNLQFLSAFSAAAGKRSYQYPDSEESDPEWGCWSVVNELRNPSIKIVFPTIQRVKNTTHGLQHSRRMLSLPEKTWERLRSAGIFHDAIPHPHDRVGYPMHVKVARRRFESKVDGSSFGWIYCGSHNFSAAAWGQTLRPSPESKVHGASMVAPLGERLHICNYELGIIIVVPPTNLSSRYGEGRLNLDDFVLPFVIPTPKYQGNDRPATAQAMREAVAEANLQNISSKAVLAEDIDEDVPDEEEEVIEDSSYLVEEKEEEKIYAEMMWSQMDSSES